MLVATQHATATTAVSARIVRASDQLWTIGTRSARSIALGREGGGGSGSRVETTTVTTSGSHLDAREVVVVAAWM